MSLAVLMPDSIMPGLRLGSRMAVLFLNLARLSWWLSGKLW